MEQSQVEEEEDDWDFFSSSSPSSSSPAPPVPSTSKVRPPTTTLPSSPECSMNDDSSTDGESLETARVKRRATGSLQHRADSREFQATTALQRRIMIKELQAKTQQECLALCCSLLPLQQKWRQELEDPIPGVVSFNHLKEEEKMNRKDIPSLRSETHFQRSISKASASATPTSLNNATSTATDSSLRRTSKAPMRRRLPWRGNEREAIRRGILMFGVGRSEKVRGVMRSSVKHLQHGLGDIADCCWEFVRACSAYADLRDRAFVENLLYKTNGLGIEVGSEVSERVGQWEKMEKSGAVWLKRIRLLDSLAHVIKLCANPRTQEIVYNAINSLGDATVPCDWWTREADLALLAGVYRHGFGNYEALRMDDEFVDAFKPSRESREMGLGTSYHEQNTSKTFFEHNSEAEPLAREYSGEPAWPDSNVLTRRFKRLVEHLGRINEQV
ncbi:hypothetical protein L7F22_031525 [Adiantum nelumboides]|nr:hypothetical protein [Adiantum nelumboides]